MKVPVCNVPVFIVIMLIFSMSSFSVTVPGDSGYSGQSGLMQSLFAGDGSQYEGQFGYDPEKGINAQDEYGRTPLHYVALNENLEALEFFVKKGANLNHKDNEGSTPLHWAIGSKNLVIAQYLIENGAEVNTRDKYGHTPLHKAAHYGSIAITRFLISRGARLTARTRSSYEYKDLTFPSGSTPMDIARIAGRADMVKLLSIYMAKRS
ncbi:MAG: ankyrin repeat domain-containing protein [bacterium]|nr:ankyrin repeat domain-containing protein [bacterium]